MRQRRYLFPLLLAVATLCLYVATLVPGPASGDPGEFQYMSRVLGLPHPPGFPLYLLVGWLWSWLPLGSLAWRMNLLSALFAALTIGVVVALTRQQGRGYLASLGGALAFALAPGVWRHATVAEVYSLNTLLLATALLLWFRWSALARAGKPATTRTFYGAAFVTGLGLTNHPTFAFVVPAVLLFLLLELRALRRRERRQSQGDGAGWRPRWQNALVGGALFAAPGLLYSYVPLRLVALDPGTTENGMIPAISRGVMSPFIRREWGWDGVIHYILDRSYVSDLRPEWDQLLHSLLPLLRAEIGIPCLLLAFLGALLWLRRRPHHLAALGTLFFLDALYGLTILSRISTMGEELDPAATLMPAVLVAALCITKGLDGISEAAGTLLKSRRAAVACAGVTLLLALSLHPARHGDPVAPLRQQSADIHRYWTEVLAYPLEEEAALAGHWGDLTPFWYFQHGEQRRPDLWGVYPPQLPEIERWLSASGRPLYVAGPLMGWEAQMAEQYELTPWGILVRLLPRGSEGQRPNLLPRQEQFGEQLRLVGYTTVIPASGRMQLWLGWESIAPTPRDLSVSLRLHAPDDSVLLQQDTRLASLWYPDSTLPAGLWFLTVFDLTLPPDAPPGSTMRIVVYDPNSGQPLLTPTGEQVVEVGPLDVAPPGQ